MTAAGLAAVGLLLLVAGAGLAARPGYVAPWCLVPLALGLWALIGAAVVALL